jgi:hypothetical protein
MQQQQQQQQDRHQMATKQKHLSLSSLPSCSTDSAEVLNLHEDDIRRRILEVKKQKKAPTAWSAASSPYALAAFFSIIVGVIICLSLVPEDSRSFNNKGNRERSSERLASDSYEDDDDQEQQGMYDRQQQERQWQRREQQQEVEASGYEESEWSAGREDDNFYKETASGADDGDDDYAPWKEKPARNDEPTHSRTHRVVQQRLVPPHDGDHIRV